MKIGEDYRMNEQRDVMLCMHYPKGIITEKSKGKEEVIISILVNEHQKE